MMIFTSGTSGNPKAVPFAHGMAVVCGRVWLRNWISPPPTSVTCRCRCSIPTAWRPDGRWRSTVVRRWPRRGSRHLGSSLISAATADIHELRREATGAGAGDPGTPRRRGQHPCAPHSLTRPPTGTSTEFTRRFDCRVIDGFGSSEFAVIIVREDGTPPGFDRQGLSRGRDLPSRGGNRMCDRGFRRGRCIGQLRRSGGGVGEHVRHGAFRGLLQRPGGHPGTGAARDVLVGGSGLPGRSGLDLCGRTADWLRVDGENLGGRPDRTDSATTGSGAPGGGVRSARRTGRRPGDGGAGAGRWADADSAGPRGISCSATRSTPKAWPRYVRINGVLPQTATNKILKRALIAEGVTAGDGVLWERPTGALPIFRRRCRVPRRGDAGLVKIQLAALRRRNRRRDAVMRPGVRCCGFRPTMVVEDIEIGEPRRGEVTVALEAAGLCHSDQHLVTGAIPSVGFPVLGRQRAPVSSPPSGRMSSISPSATMWCCRSSRPAGCARVAKRGSGTCVTAARRCCPVHR